MTKTMYKNDVPSPCAAAIGFFDGVHRGHASLIHRLTRIASERSLEPVLITFAEHPRTVVQPGYRPRLLTTNAERERLFATLGITRCEVLPFDSNMAAMTAGEFMQQVLCRRLNVRLLLTGYDTRFGHNRTEGFDDYVRYGSDCGIEVLRYEALTIDGINISSSAIRRLLDEGDVEKAALCLGHRYELLGRVARGMQIGRRIGFPTANIVPADENKVIPANGVYAVTVSIDGERQQRCGILNIGHRPTFGGGDLSIEVHVFDFEDDIYDSTMTVTFAARLRPERAFASADDLARQIRLDKAAALQLLTTDTNDDLVLPSPA